MELERQFPGRLKITGEGTPTATGWFEVQLPDGTLAHSKKNGDGYVDSEKKWKKIFDAVSRFM